MVMVMKRGVEEGIREKKMENVSGLVEFLRKCKKGRKGRVGTALEIC